ncbi:MAG: response regulator [Pirellulaceae bacterium]
MLVEHQDEIFARLAADLASLLWQVTRASNASAASRRFAARPSDLMIANVDLPDESGWLLAAKVRLVYPTAHIWLYTAHPLALDRDRARYLGVARLIHYGGDLLRLRGKILNRLTRHP